MISIKHISKTYGSLQALKGLSLDIPQGELFGLLGPNGAGKSTLMHIISGCIYADSGTVTLGDAESAGGNTPDAGEEAGDGGHAVARAAQVRQYLGFVPQQIALYEELTCLENLRVFGAMYGLGGKTLAERIAHNLESVQLSERARSKVKALSGGMKRRLNIAASLLHNPKILLCDEPTVGVDPQSRNAIFDFLRKRHRDGMTIIYSTHYMEEAERLCQRIGIIDHGEIIALGKLGELLDQAPAQESISFRKNEETLGLVPSLEAFGAIEDQGDNYLLLPKKGFRLSAFFGRLEEQGIPGHWFQIQRPTLEDLFLHRTGRSLRDN